MSAHLEDRAQCTFSLDNAAAAKVRSSMLILLTPRLKDAAAFVFYRGSVESNINLGRMWLIHLKRYHVISLGMLCWTILNLLLFIVVFLGRLRLHLTFVTSSISELLKAPLPSLVDVPVCCFVYIDYLLGVTSSLLEHGNQVFSIFLFLLFVVYLHFFNKRYFFLVFLLRCMLCLFHFLFGIFSLLSVVPLCVSLGKTNMRGLFRFSDMILLITLVFLLLAAHLSFLIHYL